MHKLAELAGIATRDQAVVALDHVNSTDELVFDRGDAAEMFRTADAMYRLSNLE